MVGKCILLHQNGLLTDAMRLVSLPGDGVWLSVLLVVAVAAYFYYQKDKLFAMAILFAPLFGQITKVLLKKFFQIPRPDAFGCNVFTTYNEIYSFPSGHTTFYTIFFGLLAYCAVKHMGSWRSKVAFAFSIFMIAAIGYSRVYLGAHWYLDIIGGYILGGAILLVTILVYRHLLNRKATNVDS